MFPFSHSRGGGAVAAITTWNPADKGPRTDLTNNNLTATNNLGTQDSTNRSTTSRSAGKVSFRVTTNNNIANCGIATSAPANTDALGFANGSIVIQMSTGGRWYTYVNGSPSTDGTVSPGPMDVLIDFTVQKLWFQVGGTVLNGNPAAGTGGIAIPAGSLFAAVNTATSGVSHTLDTSVSRYSGFSAWG